MRKAYKSPMTKLNERKINWIRRQLERDELSVLRIAKTQNITPRRVRQIRQYEKETGKVFELKKERTVRRRVITAEEIKAVVEARSRYKLGAIFLEKAIEKDVRIHIPHNIIQRVLEEGGFAVPLKKRVKRRDWVRWERKHSNSCWHTDWTQLEDGTWLITFEDDASRKVVSWGVFDNATSEHSVEVLKEGIRTHGKPREILSGHDSQFYANEAEGRGQGKTIFQIFLETEGIKHILGRINHPQTNGKQERLFGTIKSKLDEFDSIAELITWYNDVKPHMSLDFDNLETPSQAFVRKMHHSAKQKAIIGLPR